MRATRAEELACGLRTASHQRSRYRSRSTCAGRSTDEAHPHSAYIACLGSNVCSWFRYLRVEKLSREQMGPPNLFEPLCSVGYLLFIVRVSAFNATGDA